MGAPALKMQLSVIDSNKNLCLDAYSQKYLQLFLLLPKTSNPTLLRTNIRSPRPNPRGTPLFSNKGPRLSSYYSGLWLGIPENKAMKLLSSKSIFLRLIGFAGGPNSQDFE